MKLAAVAKVVLALGLFLWGQSGHAAVKDELPPKAVEISRQTRQELDQTLASYLKVWGARDEGGAAWASLPFAQDTIDTQAQTVIAIIEANHAAQGGAAARPSVVVQATLQAAATITKPYTVFYEPTQPAHPLLAGAGPEVIFLTLKESHGGSGLADALKASMREDWKDYTGRMDLSGMVGEEAPGPLVQWLFAEAVSRRARADVPDLDKVCPETFNPVWSCQSSAEGRVEALCLGGGTARKVQFRTIMPGEAPSWTLPDSPLPAAEVMGFWVNGGALVTEISKGPQSLTLMKSDGPMGTDGRVMTEFNMNPGRPRDCKILSDTIVREFNDLIPCEDRFDAAACPFSYILPYSNQREVKLHELRGFSAGQLKLAQAEIFVRHGPQLHSDEEKAHFGAREWFAEAGGNVSLEVLSEIEQANIHFIQNLRRQSRSQDDAQWRLPAGGAHWRGDIVFADGRKGSLAGSDHRILFTPNDGARGWLYLPRDGELYMFDESSAAGAIEPDWRAPWLLPTEVLKALDVKVIGEASAKIARVAARCFALSGRQEDYGGIEGNDLWLSGDICLTADGIPVKVEMKGGHELEGQDDVMPWEYGYEMTKLRRAIQPEAAFTPPAGKQWNRPG